MEMPNVVCMACDYLLCHIVYTKMNRTDLDTTHVCILYTCMHMHTLTFICIIIYST